jgi:molybdopterin-guanine dinucleotide biosynthesis protein A
LISGVILAGGKNRRMRGRVKALLPFHGSTFLDVQLKEMKKVCTEILLVTNEPDLFSFALDEQVLIMKDRTPGLGPLGGMEAAFSKVRHSDIWVVGCDMPFLSGRVAQVLAELRTQSACDAVIPVVKGKIQPLHAVYHRDCGKQISYLLQSGARQVTRFLDSIDSLYVDEAFFEQRSIPVQFAENVNTPEDYQRILARE